MKIVKQYSFDDDDEHTIIILRVFFSRLLEIFSPAKPKNSREFVVQFSKMIKLEMSSRQRYNLIH